MTLLAVLGLIGLVGVLMFAGIIPGGVGPLGSKAVEEVVMWGPYSGLPIESYFFNFNKENENLVKIKYVAQTPESYENNLIEAFARGQGPDLIFINQKMLNRLAGKITTIPYEVYPQRDILNNFVDGASVFMNSKGLKAMPLFIDPLVMFYNRTMYTSANIIIPPKDWTEFLATIKPIVEIDSRNNITRTAVAMGEFRNVTNAKYILSALLFQAGNPIITTNTDDSYKSVFSNDFGFTPSPIEASISFFRQFSNPSQVSYSWNRSMPNDKDMFVAEKLSTYFGLASELSDLQAKNPHLNLDTVVIPQKDPQKRVTYANFYGVVITKGSKKQNSSLTAAVLLSQAKNQDVLASVLGYLPVRRDLLSVKVSDPFLQVFKESSVISRSWVDPDPIKTNQALEETLESIQMSQTNFGESVKTLDDKINRLFSSP